MSLDHHTAKAANGPAVVAYLERRGVLRNLQSAKHGTPEYERIVKSLGPWRRGRQPTVWALDRFLIMLGIHLSELPPEVWEQPDRRRGAGERAA